MASKSRLKWGRLFIWYVVLSALILAGGALFAPLDSILYNTLAAQAGKTQDGQAIHLLQEGDATPVSESQTIETRRLVCPSVGYINLRKEQLMESYAAVDMRAQDFAALLNKISQSGVRNLAISAPFIWEGGTQDAGQLVLCATLQNKKYFERTVLGMRGRTSAQADLTPIQFRSFVIPSHQVKGDVSLLPAANRQVENDLDTADDTTQLTWAPDWLEDEPLTQIPAAVDDRSFPLLMRWNGEILPTLPLRMALSIRSCNPDKVKVDLGNSISFDGITLPIDSHGRLTLKNTHVQELGLADLIDGKAELKDETGKFKLAVLGQPLTDQEPATRTQLMAATLSQLCAYTVTDTKLVPGEPLPSLCYRPIVSSYWLFIVTVLVGLFFVLLILPYFPGVLRLLALFGALAYALNHVWGDMQNGYWSHAGLLTIAWVLLFWAVSSLKPEKKRNIFSSSRRR